MNILIVGIRSRIANYLEVDHSFERAHLSHSLWCDDKGNVIKHVSSPSQLRGVDRDAPIIEHPSLGLLRSEHSLDIRLMLMNRFENVVDTVEELIQ